MWWIILLIFTVPVMLFIAGWLIGKQYATQYKVFSSKLKHLDFLVRHAYPNSGFKEGIEKEFKEIKQYDCGNCNDEKQIKELEIIFKERFKEI